MSGAAPPAASLCLRAPAGRSLQLRGAGDTAVSEAMRSAQHACPWDVVTGPGRFNKLYYEKPLLEGEREDEVELVGTEVNFTLFRNVETGAVVELVDAEDVPGLAGFFRMLTSDIFDVMPDAMAYADAALDCPAHACYVNGHYTGDFLVAQQLHNALKAAPGSCLVSPRAMRSAQWDLAPPPHLPQHCHNSHPCGGGGESENGRCDGGEEWRQRVGNWTAVQRGACLVLRHVAYRTEAVLILEPRGLVYMGCPDLSGLLTMEARCVLVRDDSPPRNIEFTEARQIVEALGLGCEIEAGAATESAGRGDGGAECCVGH
eukprot:Tamp_23765.p1 GENE.Tamp_23765~~Tamp_23765.p1  ORF type:complete len:331 (-),score=45.53 Tamp_23765:29-979(-)